MDCGNISIHALVKRATVPASHSAEMSGNFNPRPREEGDFTQITGKEVCVCISIHALVKRATTVAETISTLMHISIHALVKRATRIDSQSYKAECISIHALVKRATRGIFLFSFLTFYFNPRPREEGD